jgi:hypothetical protein
MLAPRPYDVVLRPRARPWALVVPVLLALAALAARRMSWEADDPVPPVLLPLPPDRCPGADGCAFSPLATAPTATQVEWALVFGDIRPGDPPGPHVRPLGSEWEAIVDPTDRAFLASVLSVAVQNPLILWSFAEVSGWVAAQRARYLALRGIAWDEQLRTQRARVTASNARALAAFAAAVAARDPDPGEVSGPDRIDLAVLVLTALGVAGAAVWRRTRGRVGLDPDGLRVGRERLGWTDIEAVDWYDGRVEVRLVDGSVRLRDGLHMAGASVEALEQATEQLRASAEPYVTAR